MSALDRRTFMHTLTLSIDGYEHTTVIVSEAIELANFDIRRYAFAVSRRKIEQHLEGD